MIGLRTWACLAVLAMGVSTAWECSAKATPVLDGTGLAPDIAGSGKEKESRSCLPLDTSEFCAAVSARVTSQTVSAFHAGPGGVGRWSLLEARLCSGISLVYVPDGLLTAGNYAGLSSDSGGTRAGLHPRDAKIGEWAVDLAPAPEGSPTSSTLAPAPGGLLLALLGSGLAVRVRRP